MIYGNVINSVIFPGVYIKEGATVKNSIIMSDCIIGENSYLDTTIVSEGTEIGSDVIVGAGDYAENKFNPKVYNSDISVIGSDVKLPNKMVLGKNVMVDNFVTSEDVTEYEIPSGHCIIKGGVI